MTTTAPIAGNVLIYVTKNQNQTLITRFPSEIP